MFDSYAKNTLRFYADRCTNCRRCTQVCPHGVFAEGTRTAVLTNHRACMECGACQNNCPSGAIEVESGVGCASAMIRAALKGKSMDNCNCDCGGATTSSCCGGNGQEEQTCSCDRDT